VQLNPYTPPGSEVVKNDPSPKPSGLGGWLVLVGAGLILSPLMITVLMVKTIAPIVRDGSWEAISSASSDVYNPALVAFFACELLVNLGFVVASVWLLVLFFRRSRKFPSLFVAYCVVNLAFVVLDAWIVSWLLPEIPMDDEDMREMARTVLNCLIWVPYMLRSRRVKNTFVVGPPSAATISPQPSP